MSRRIDVSDLDQAELLAALYNAAAPLGLGKFQDKPGGMTKADAAQVLKESESLNSPTAFDFDYVHGRPIKCRIDEHGFLHGERLFDRDAGIGALQRVLEELRSK